MEHRASSALAGVSPSKVTLGALPPSCERAGRLAAAQRIGQRAGASEGATGRVSRQSENFAPLFPISLTDPARESTHRGPHRGSNSVVECNLAKVDVEGSNPFSRSEKPK